MAAEVGEAGLRSCCIIENTSKSSKTGGKGFLAGICSRIHKKGFAEMLMSLLVVKGGFSKSF